MSETVDALARLLEERQLDFSRSIGPGLDDAGVARLCGDLDVESLPPTLESLYRWGALPEPVTWDPEADDTWWLLSPRGALDARSALGEREAEARARTIPFLRNGSGDCLCAVNDPDVCSPGAKWRVVEVPLGRPERPERFGSVSRWLELTVDGLQRDLLTLEESGGLRPTNPIAWEAYLDRENPGFVNGEPPEEPLPTAGPTAILQRLAAGLTTLCAVALVVVAKVFRTQIPRGGFVALLLGFGLAGLFLLVAMAMGSRAESLRRSAEELSEGTPSASGVQRDQPVGAVSQREESVEGEGRD